eukprot:CAMPEP_0171305154 /NCGR_PEP_ID=MMETSP0816-20121228/14943_1 /TAXON_ID=420281 /ORGANISM="Proboscia inermis, Strain CCAP1064/1" /LENGTH=102 /DNA_ID=CAMNT_0011785751 /DNA_START=43 /DNA_END=351 /DNA_ORIENTATION=-
MTEDRIQLLNKLGFEWEFRHNPKPWDISYEELVCFVKEFGHARVPQQFPKNPSLGKWVRTQRQNYEKVLKGGSSSNITEDRIQLLNKIGFEWVPRGKFEFYF